MTEIRSVSSRDTHEVVRINCNDNLQLSSVGLDGDLAFFDPFLRNRPPPTGPEDSSSRRASSRYNYRTTRIIVIACDHESNMQIRTH